MAVSCTIWTQHTEMTVGKLTVEFIYPSLDAKMLSRTGQFLHLDNESGKYPHMVAAYHLLITKSMLACVHRSTTEQEVAQVAPGKISAIIL